MAGVSYLVFSVFFLSLGEKLEGTKCFSDRTAPAFPKDHLFSSKQKPLVIGHRGNPMNFQENTLESFTSLMDTNADGFELDIYLTKDEQLVLYHDDTTTFLTGETHFMWNMTYEELRRLDINKTIVKGNRAWHFPKSAKIPLLKDVLEAVRESDLLMYLEMKPSYTRDLGESAVVGKAVAKLVRELGLERRAMINSFDPFKCLAAKQENPDVPVGTFYKRDWWKREHADKLKKDFAKLPGMADCVQASPNGSEFLPFIFQNGAVFKSINASFVDMDYKIYNNPLYSNDTFQTLRANYSPSISAGAWTLYSMSQSEAEWDASEEKIASLVKLGAQRFITDNVTRMLEKLGRPITRVPTTARSPTSGVRHAYSDVSFVMFLMAIVAVRYFF